MQELVYCMATVHEIQRISAVGPGSLPHVLTKPTTVHGYNFPEGSIFMANLTKFMCEPDVFSSPNEFRPERFIEIDADGKQKIKVYIMNMLKGGINEKPVSPYNHYAINSIFLPLYNRKPFRMFLLVLVNALVWESRWL